MNSSHTDDEAIRKTASLIGAQSGGGPIGIGLGLGFDLHFAGLGKFGRARVMPWCCSHTLDGIVYLQEPMGALGLQVEHYS